MDTSSTPGVLESLLPWLISRLIRFCATLVSAGVAGVEVDFLITSFSVTFDGESAFTMKDLHLLSKCCLYSCSFTIFPQPLIQNSTESFSNDMNKDEGGLIVSLVSVSLKQHGHSKLFVIKMLLQQHSEQIVSPQDSETGFTVTSVQIQEQSLFSTEDGKKLGLGSSFGTTAGARDLM